ncbi:hypothetical protein GUJ93_ZPchr0001g32887 [Zizania palustris]|uniref:CCHC-type domain-containing protein n=1 Tax=Zizania palustris TaxID=103762 RepID=A0A8J5UZI4_ZIZPA|nr:hypothetical protein GUJ93_ZPchr0001g32887 [Zizania palustris]
MASSRPCRGDNPRHLPSVHPCSAAAADAPHLDTLPSLSAAPSSPRVAASFSPSILELIGISDGLSVSDEGSPLGSSPGVGGPRFRSIPFPECAEPAPLTAPSLPSILGRPPPSHRSSQICAALPPAVGAALPPPPGPGCHRLCPPPFSPSSFEGTTSRAPPAPAVANRIYSSVSGSKSHVLSRLQNADGSQWVPVRRRYWWRQKTSLSASRPQQEKDMSSLRRQKFLQAMLGKCFNCLSRSHKVADCRAVTRCWICKSSGHISTYCAFKALPKAAKGSSPSSSRSPELSLKHSVAQRPSATPSAEMEPIFPNSAIPGITGDRHQEDFSFVAASGEIDEKVVELSNHALVAWEMGLPDDRESKHPPLRGRLLETLQCPSLGHPDAIPKVVWLTSSNPDSDRDVQHTPALEVAPLPVSFTSLKLAHAYKVLVHIDRIKNLTFVSRSSLEKPQCFDWVYGVPDGEVPKYFVRNPDTCSYLKPPRPRDFDKDPEEGSDRSLPPRGKSIWSRIGHQDEPRVIPQNRRPGAAQGGSTA